MKSKKTNILLGIIAINLTLLTLIQLEIWPVKANANTNELELNSNLNYGLVPLNVDGSIDVNINSSNGTMDVNIEYIRGYKAGFTKEGDWVGLDVVPATCSGTCVHY